jgi:tricorn protease
MEEKGSVSVSVHPQAIRASAPRIGGPGIGAKGQAPRGLFPFLMSALIALGSISAIAPPSPAAPRAVTPVTSPFLASYVAVGPDRIAFTYAGDIWLVGRRGGTARRLTTHPGPDESPSFSPDGKTLAFSRDIAGNLEVFVAPVAGGDEKRLTFHPKPDRVKGWSADGGSVLFVSTREGDLFIKLFTAPATGGLASPLNLPSGVEGAFSPDGRRLAYIPISRGLGSISMRHYRGGSPLWIIDLETLDIEEVTTDATNARYPFWVGGTIYFLGDESGVYNLCAYDTKAKRIDRLTDFDLFGIQAMSACRDAVAFVHEGRIHVFDPRTRKTTPLQVSLEADAAELAPRAVPVERFVRSADVSDSGERVLFECRGEAILFDPKTGLGANLTKSPGIAERSPRISPEGRRIAFFSDESGEYALHVVDTATGAVVREFAVEDKPSFYREPAWSPDGSRIVFSDIRLALWLADVEAGTAKAIDASTYMAQGEYNPVWSAGGRYLAYAKALENRLRAIFIFDTADGTARRVTDGTTHCEFPAFDRSGRYLYFSSSLNARRAAASDIGWGLLSTQFAEPMVTKTLHAAILRRGDPPPVQSAVRRPHPAQIWKKPAGEERIDFDGIEKRIALIPAGFHDVAGLASGSAGELYVLKRMWPETPGAVAGGDPPTALFKLSLDRPTAVEPFAAGVAEFQVSPDGRLVLYQKGSLWFLSPAGAPPGAEAAPLDLKAVAIDVQPRLEWRQMYREAWRQMRDVFYDPSHHGLDLAALERRFEAFLPSVTRRADLNSLFLEMYAMFSVSHLTVGGGDIPPSPQEKPEAIGDIGADFEAAGGRVRIKKIIRSGHFSSPNPLFRGPLDAPDVDAREGDYLVAVDGEAVSADRDVHAHFLGKANRDVTLTLAASADGTGKREAVVFAQAGTGALRMDQWARENARKVEELSGGTLAYVYIPNYGAGAGIEEFYRAVLGYSDRAGLIIDQRYNGGGTTADSLIEALTASPLYAYDYRYGRDFPVPPVFFPGPKVLITNGLNWSAAETFAEMFKLAKVGKIVGGRTGGGGIGVALFQPPLIDGGEIGIPNRAAFNPAGSWDIENYGVTPDIAVDIMPKDWAAGRDVQIETAVATALEMIRTAQPRPPFAHPPYPVHVKIK